MSEPEFRLAYVPYTEVMVRVLCSYCCAYRSEFRSSVLFVIQSIVLKYDITPVMLKAWTRQVHQRSICNVTASTRVKVAIVPQNCIGWRREELLTGRSVVPMHRPLDYGPSILPLRLDTVVHQDIVWNVTWTRVKAAIVPQNCIRRRREELLTGRSVVPMHRPLDYGPSILPLRLDTLVHQDIVWNVTWTRDKATIVPQML
jgi:hypothetical protein